MKVAEYVTEQRLFFWTFVLNFLTHAFIDFQTVVYIYNDRSVLTIASEIAFVFKS